MTSPLVPVGFSVSGPQADSAGEFAAALARPLPWPGCTPRPLRNRSAGLPVGASSATRSPWWTGLLLARLHTDEPPVAGDWVAWAIGEHTTARVANTLMPVIRRCLIN